MRAFIRKRLAVLVTLFIVIIALIVVGVATRSAPSAPQSVHVAAGETSVAVSWSPPAKDGGSAVTHYRASASPGGKWCTASTMTCTITGLTNGTAYVIRVSAVNTVGTSTAASSSSVTTNYAACAYFWGLASRPVSTDVLAALTKHYTANHLMPIRVVNNREKILVVAEQTIGAHHCANSDGSTASYTGMVPTNATSAVMLEVSHQPYPMTGGSISFVTQAKTTAGWTVVNEGTGP